MIHKGWHSRGYLPHFESGETTQFITIRLADSLPRAKLETWQREVDQMFSGFSKRKVEIQRRINKFLDSGYGDCDLKEAAIAEMVEQSLLHFDGEHYRLLSWVVMPNHVHALFEMGEEHTLGQILRTWKSFSAREANKLRGKTGNFWQRDYFDRFIRDEEHFQRVVAYIEDNPVKAGLCLAPQDWPYGSARFNLRS